jgi:hypothetical protein
VQGSTNNGADGDCTDCADLIQALIGGVIERIQPAGGRPALGPTEGPAPEDASVPRRDVDGPLPDTPDHSPWAYHDVVVQDGKVYDAWTGRPGLDIQAYKDLWKDKDDIQWPF